MRLIDDLTNLFFPPVCHICDNRLSPGERFICQPCLESLPRTGYHRTKMNPMEERFAGHFPFVAATGHFFYSRDSSLSQLFQDMKYRGFPSIGNVLGEIVGRELFTAGFLSDIDVIVPVPMHFYKKAMRGYNQVDRIAMGIEKATGIPFVDALRMTRRRKTQTALTQTQRLANAENLFSVRKNIDLSDKSVLLVDDVCTTGSTMSSAAKTITDAFPSCRLSLLALGVTF